MNKQWWLAALVTVGLTPLGCLSEQPVALGDDRDPAHFIQTGPPAPSRPRLQKAEGESQKPEPSAINAPFTPSPEAAAGQNVGRIRVIVNYRPILDGEVQQVCGQMLRGASSPAEQANILVKTLAYLVDQELIYQDAMAKLNQNGKRVVEKMKEAANKEFEKTVRENKKRMNVRSEEEFKQILNQQGVSLETMRRQVERTFIAQEYMRARILPSIEHRVGHEQIKEYYEKHPEEFVAGDAVVWEDVFVDIDKHNNRDEAYALAQQIAARLRAGEKIEAFAKIDDGDSAPIRKGLGQGSKRGEIRPVEAEAVVFRLRDSEVGGPIEMLTGFHIVRVVKRTFAGPMAFDDKTQNLIRNKLQNEIFEVEQKRFVAELKRKAQIEYANSPP
jgi:parvulin-like peptidyl-prolyl isomerase